MTSILSRIWLLVKIFVSLVFFWIVYQCTSPFYQKYDTPKKKEALGVAVAESVNGITSGPLPCSPRDFTVKNINTREEYGRIVLTATVINNSATSACGVQLKASTYDKSGAVLDTSDFWPASIRNISPGASENFSTRLLRHSGREKTFDVVPISSKTWSGG